jgi:hypothetical protein
MASLSDKFYETEEEVPSNIHSVGFKACTQSGFTNSARFTNSDVNAILFVVR